eukprot:1534564-Pleurochrysis_carterae.AAC.1
MSENQRIQAKAETAEMIDGTTDAADARVPSTRTCTDAPRGKEKARAHTFAKVAAPLSVACGSESVHPSRQL